MIYDKEVANTLKEQMELLLERSKDSDNLTVSDICELANAIAKIGSLFTAH